MKLNYTPGVLFGGLAYYKLMGFVFGWDYLRQTPVCFQCLHGDYRRDNCDARKCEYCARPHITACCIMGYDLITRHRYSRKMVVYKRFNVTRLNYDTIPNSQPVYTATSSPPRCFLVKSIMIYSIIPITRTPDNSNSR